ncbi:FAD-binding oxidoreductase [Oscillatoria sp. FACHB-1407]|uniref:NAD(P)/FAD-dependent oxidoreductase n=1 Tax=Oscillatoria sp. FACHB-1407 TaxID=2692847 RepID=UPI00168A1AE5|nr:FAD-dependent oxidoreductase [Oscillatoria sp. FACHB-1407]MBD2464304.1 FAD-binding oxidoreductase [Oscillatoria sp. FACHB-1407]
MSRVAVIGCGVVGAAIAYELSQVPELQVTVFDRQPPAQASTGAALGVLMGIISHKVKGNAWDLRRRSMRRYETLIPELEGKTGNTIPFNRQGIVLLCFEGDDLQSWQHLAQTRHDQGYSLGLWDLAELQVRCPHIQNSRLIGAIHSPGDRQLDPTALTLAFVEAARQNGVTFEFNNPVEKIESLPDEPIHRLSTSAGVVEADWVVLSAGLGTTPLTQVASTPVEIRPVLGQAIRIKVSEMLGDRHFQPVITGEDVHLVPLGNREYWVGATVEFPTDAEVRADQAQLEAVWQKAIALCPALATAERLQAWSGLRPRPHNQPAPIIAPLVGYNRVLLATGHYRNGVLLAPATAQTVCKMIMDAMVMNEESKT